MDYADGIETVMRMFQSSVWQYFATIKFYRGFTTMDEIWLDIRTEMKRKVFCFIKIRHPNWWVELRFTSCQISLFHRFSHLNGLFFFLKNVLVVKYILKRNKVESTTIIIKQGAEDTEHRWKNYIELKQRLLWEIKIFCFKVYVFVVRSGTLMHVVLFFALKYTTYWHIIIFI